MTRWKAAGIHLALSAVIIGAIAFGLIQVWYGWELFTLMGGAKLLTILAACDILIGPLLTLIVYKRGKPSLRFDLAVIMLLQLGFLAYGMHIMAKTRPVFLVGVLDRYELVFADELSDADLAKGELPDHRTRSWFGPRMVGALLGSTSQERLNLALSGYDGKDIQLLPERYTDIADVWPALRRSEQPAEALAASSPEARARLEAFASRHERTLQDLSTLAIVSRRARATMLHDTKTGEILGPLALEPWPELAK